MAKTKANEREFAGQVIHWIKEQLKEGGLPFESATNDSGVYGLASVKFPDVLLTLDFEGLRPFCGWELKTPKTDARDKELLKGAVEKAQQIEAKYFVTWNMQSAVIWRTPERTRVTVREDDKVREFGPDTRITRVDDIRDAEKAELLRDMCRRLVLDLGRLYEDEKVNLPVADTTVFVSMVAAASNKMEESLLRDIRSARGNREFARKLTSWATKQGVNKYDQEYERSLAQQIAYKIIGKILFYITLRRQNLHLPKLDLKGENYKAAMKRMRGLFQAALEVDYQAIFERDITDEIELSRDTADVVIELTDKLTHWTFEQVPLDVVGNVLERLVPVDARHSLGQYFTPDRLADLIIGFCVQNGEGLVMDPTCGTGTFLIRSYSRLRQLGAKRQPHHQLLDQIWGFDIAGFPAELATINLCRQDLSDYQNFPRVLAKDFFEVAPGGEFEFPPPKKMVKPRERARVKIPRFDALVGNFPFIRQEKIEKAEPGYKEKLARALYQSWGLEYHELFPNVNKRGRGELDVELALSGQADIYAYMFFHAAGHVKVGGRMGFITSNSWLDVAYGYELQRFFLSKFKVVGIFESRCEPWFEQSAVNTVFTILERCDDEQQKKDNPVYFVKVKKPLAKLFPQDALTDAQARWDAITRFVEKIEELGISAENLGNAGFEKCERFKGFERINAEYVKQPEIISYEDDDIRVRIIKQGDLKKDVETAGQTVKWGQYLRGPDIYFEILEKCAENFVPLGNMAEIRFGIKTGINEFFYLTKEQAQHWRIEKEFLKPVIKSPKECGRIMLRGEDLSLLAFVCNKDKSEITGTKALKYIQWGEMQKTDEGRLWPKVESVKGRKNWYALGDREPGEILLVMTKGAKLRAIVNKERAQVDHRLFEMTCPKKIAREGLGIYLNSGVAFHTGPVKMWDT